MKWFKTYREYKEEKAAANAAIIAKFKERERKWSEEYDQCATRFLVAHAELTKFGFDIGTTVPTALGGLSLKRYVEAAERAIAELSCAD